MKPNFNEMPRAEQEKADTTNREVLDSQFIIKTERKY